MKRSIELKIKIKSLAAESQIIRNEERRASRQRDGIKAWAAATKTHRDDELRDNANLHHNLSEHRRTVVRDAARQTVLAYMFIRGRDIEANQSKCAYTRSVDRQAIKKMVERYGDKESKDRLNKHLFGGITMQAA